MQEAHLYAKFKGEIYTPYIGISLVRGSGCFYKGNYFYDFFFLVVVGYFIEVNSGGGGWNFFFLLLVGGSEISGVPPSQVYLNGTALNEMMMMFALY